MSRPYSHYRSALISEMYECNLDDAEAPSLEAVRQQCYQAAVESAGRWTQEELADWWTNWR
jgi:hypothetical protein